MFEASIKILSLLIMAVIAGCGREGGDVAQPLMSITDTLVGGDTEGYARVYQPRPFSFPADHGAHPEYKNEWWYFTGNLTAEDGREFGFQFTLFRYAVAPKMPASKSAWATNQVYLAQIALSDINQGKYYSDERFGRGAMALAGVSANPFRAWLDNWTVSAGPAQCGDCLAVDITAAAADFQLRLRLSNTRPAVLHGDRGFSRKSSSRGNASYYYSYTRMNTSGEIALNGAAYGVGGQAWFDHEWSTSSLEPEQSGWDWFSLQLSNRSELMVFRLRNRDEPDKDYYYGSLIHPDGVFEPLQKEDLRLSPLATWNSGASGISYPLTWQLDIPDKTLSLLVRPRMANQEMNRSFRYWEGAISAVGKLSGKDLTATGYMELTGY